MIPLTRKSGGTVWIEAQHVVEIWENNGTTFVATVASNDGGNDGPWMVVESPDEVAKMVSSD